MPAPAMENGGIGNQLIVVLIVVKGSYYISKTSNSNTNSYTHENYKLPEEQIERLKELSKKLKEKENL